MELWSRRAILSLNQKRPHRQVWSLTILFLTKLIQNIPLMEAEISLVLSFHKLSSLCLVQSEGLFGRLRAPFTLIDGTKKKETLSCDSAGHFTGDALLLLSQSISYRRSI